MLHSTPLSCEVGRDATANMPERNRFWVQHHIHPIAGEEEDAMSGAITAHIHQPRVGSIHLGAQVPG